MSYTCSCCGKLIKPKVSIINDEATSKIDKYEIKGGIGNKTLKNNICSECIEVALLN